MDDVSNLYRRLKKERGDRPVFAGVQLGNVLGEGGDAMVIEGFHLRLSIPVAVKIMSGPPEGEQSPLREEAHVGACVNHPNVVRVYDVGREGEYFFMIEEYVEGKTAEELVREAHDGRRLSEETVLSIGCDIARGLAAIHAEGYLHRDVKPSNVMVCSKEGMAKLLDMGLARHRMQLPADASDRPRQPLGVDGTPGYIAPEVILGRAASAASDLYGLSLTLYELLTGKLAYDAVSTTALLTQQVTQELSDPRALRPQLCPATVRIVRRCAKIEPAKRLTDANTMLNELARALLALDPPPAAASTTVAALPASIVCVDDDTEVGGFLRDTLEGAGFRVRYYADPYAGLRGIAKEPPDVVITDTHMPGMNGHDVCAAIRGTPRGAEVPVVILSSDPERESVGLAIQKGATDYLLKPTDPADLVARVQCLARMVVARREFKAMDAQYGEYRHSLNRLARGGLGS